MGNDGVEDLRHHTVSTSQKGWVREKLRETREIVLGEESWCEVLHGGLIITPDGIAKEESYIPMPQGSQPCSAAICSFR